MKTSQLAEMIKQGELSGMRSNQNPSMSTNRSAGTKLGMPLSRVPMEWLDAGSWRLPSGKALAEFALQAGFLAPLLFRAERFGKNPTNPGTLGGASEGSAPELRSKPLGKGGSQ
jgi:hypothetical protein